MARINDLSQENKIQNKNSKEIIENKTLEI